MFFRLDKTHTLCPFPYIDDGISLDVIHVWVAQAKFFASPLGGADDAGGDGVLQGERAAYRDHKLAGTKVCRATEQQHRQLHLLQQREETDTEWDTTHANQLIEQKEEVISVLVLVHKAFFYMSFF